MQRFNNLYDSAERVRFRVERVVVTLTWFTRELRYFLDEFSRARTWVFCVGIRLYYNLTIKTLNEYYMEDKKCSRRSPILHKLNRTAN